MLPMRRSPTQSRRAWLIAIGLMAACVCVACVALHSHRQTAATSQASTVPAPATAPTGALLTITIKDIRSHKGDLIFGIFAQPDGFPNVKAKSIYWEAKPADGDTVTFTTRLPPGRYAAGVLHDENRSGDMDTGLAGIPLEGYGVTNNPKPVLRKATFNEATFTLPPQGATMTISLQYF